LYYARNLPLSKEMAKNCRPLGVVRRAVGAGKPANDLAKTSGLIMQLKAALNFALPVAARKVGMAPSSFVNYTSTLKNAAPLIKAENAVTHSTQTDDGDADVAR
jgi:hypothetical protein